MAIRAIWRFDVSHGFPNTQKRGRCICYEHELERVSRKLHTTKYIRRNNGDWLLRLPPIALFCCANPFSMSICSEKPNLIFHLNFSANPIHTAICSFIRIVRVLIDFINARHRPGVHYYVCVCVCRSHFLFTWYLWIGNRAPAYSLGDVRAPHIVVGTTGTKQTIFIRLPGNRSTEM